MPLLQLLLVVLYTILLGSFGIVLCILVPGGSALLPLARFWSFLILKTYGVRSRVTSRVDLAKLGPCVFVSNHQSQFDIPALVVALPVNFRMVAKRELLYIPFFGWALWLAGFIFIDRHDRKKAIRRLDRAIRTLQRGISIVVFAEGTRSPDGRLLPFKKGGFILAMQAGVPIVPVSIRGGREVLPKGSLRVRPGTLDITLGAPLPTSSYRMETKDELMALVRERIATGLQTEPVRAIPDRAANPGV